MDKLKITTKSFITTYVFFMITITLWLICDFKSENTTMILAWLGNGLFVFGIYVFYKFTLSHINQYTFFWVSFYLFSYGQVFLYSFGLSYVKFDLFKQYPIELINQYIIYFILGVIFILTASIFVLKKVKNEESNDTQISEKSIKIVFITLLCVSAPIYFSTLLRQVIAVQSFGYNIIYDLPAETNSIVDSISMWFIPSLLVLLNVYKKRNYKYLILLFLIIPVIAYLYIGTRSRPLAIICCLIYLWHSTIQPVKRKHVILFIFLFFLIFMAIPYISSIRGQSDRSLFDLFNISFNNSFKESFVYTVGEMGSSMQIWLRLQYLMPYQYPFAYGFSYFSSVLACIPSFLLGGFSFSKFAILSAWITKVEGENYGLGFSTMGEAYYNFGWLGILALFFIGYLIFTALSGKWSGKRMIHYRNSISAIALYIFISTGRGSLYLSIRHIVYCILIPLLLIYLLDKNFRRRL